MEGDADYDNDQRQATQGNSPAFQAPPLRGGRGKRRKGIFNGNGRIVPPFEGVLGEVMKDEKQWNIKFLPLFHFDKLSVLKVADG